MNALDAARTLRQQRVAPTLLAENLAQFGVPAHEALQALLHSEGAALTTDSAFISLLWSSSYSDSALCSVVKSIAPHDPRALVKLLPSSDCPLHLKVRLASLLHHPEGFALAPADVCRVMQPLPCHDLIHILLESCHLPLPDAVWTLQGVQETGLSTPSLLRHVAQCFGYEALFSFLATDERFGFGPGAAARFLTADDGCRIKLGEAVSAVLFSDLSPAQMSEALCSKNGLRLVPLSFVRAVGQEVPSDGLLTLSLRFLHSPDGFHLPLPNAVRLLTHPHGGAVDPVLVFHSLLSPNGLNVAVPSASCMAHSKDGLGLSVPGTASLIYQAAGLQEAWECLVAKDGLQCPPHEALLVLVSEDGPSVSLESALSVAAHHPTCRLSPPDLVRAALDPRGVHLSLVEAVHWLADDHAGNIPPARLFALLSSDEVANYEMPTVLAAFAHPEGIGLSATECVTLLTRTDDLRFPLSTVACLLAHPDGLDLPPSEVASALFSNRQLCLPRRHVADALQFGCGLDRSTVDQLLDAVQAADERAKDVSEVPDTFLLQRLTPSQVAEMSGRHTLPRSARSPL